MPATAREKRMDWLDYRLGRFMAAERARMDWNQDVLAERLGVSRNTVCRWERGVSGKRIGQAPRITDFVTMCDLFGLDPAWALLRIIREPRTTQSATTPPKKPCESVPAYAEVAREGQPVLSELVREREGWPMPREKRAVLR